MGGREIVLKGVALLIVSGYILLIPLQSVVHISLYDEQSLPLLFEDRRSQIPVSNVGM